MKKNEIILGVIGGSGLYDIDGLTNKKWIGIKSSYGKPSDKVLHANIDGLKIRFLPRHGRNHKILPSDINFKANIEVLKKTGVTHVISVSAVGSLKENYLPGDFVLVNQFIDKTYKRNNSFFEDGIVGHVSMANPVCSELGCLILDSAKKSNIKIHSKGTYIVIEGPQFSTKAESELYRKWSCDVIGMTNMPEAKLCREAQMCYSSVAMVTDFDCWHPDHDNVTVESIIKVLKENSYNAKKLVQKIALNFNNEIIKYKCSCKESLIGSIITKEDKISSLLKKKLFFMFK